MGTWWFKIGRLAFARANYAAIGDARRLFWRLWWLLKTPLPKPITVVKTSIPVVRGPMHFSPDDRGLPLCGVNGRAMWTRDYYYATCPECREIGRGMILQYEVNVR